MSEKPLWAERMFHAFLALPERTNEAFAYAAWSYLILLLTPSEKGSGVRVEAMIKAEAILDSVPEHEVPNIAEALEYSERKLR